MTGQATCQDSTEVAAILQRKYPQAVYSHCCSHVLNLAIVNCYSCIQVQNLFAVMSKVHKFFDNHPKCQYMLNTFCEGSETKLKSLCKTRWLQHIDAFHILWIYLTVSSSHLTK